MDQYILIINLDGDVYLNLTNILSFLYLKSNFKFTQHYVTPFIVFHISFQHEI